jgi:hypothetical protein
VEIMPRKSIGEAAMTDAERQDRYRAARAADKPVIRVGRALESADRWMQHRSAPRPDHRGRPRRWNDNVAGLVEGQVEYAAWLDSLPENLRDSALAEASLLTGNSRRRAKLCPGRPPNARPM